MDETFYKHLRIYHAKGEPSASEISEIEDLLDAKLPTSFLDFLKAANGGYFEFCIDIEGDSLSFGSIYQTGKDSNGSYGFGTFVGEIESERNGFLEIPRQVLPFASDGGGSYVYLDLTEEGNGRVVAFVHGLPEWTGKPQEDRFIELAASFDEYLDLLYQCPDMI